MLGTFYGRTAQELVEPGSGVLSHRLDQGAHRSAPVIRVSERNACSPHE